MQIKAEQVHLFSILVTWYGFLPRISNQLDPPRNLLKDGWVFSQSSRKSTLMPTTSSSHINVNPATQSSIFHSQNQSRHQQSQIGIKNILFESALKKRNGKSLKYWTQISREGNYGIWWNGKVSVKTQNDPLGNQPTNSRIVQNLSRIFILYILTSQDPILQELDLLWFLVCLHQYMANLDRFSFLCHLDPYGGKWPFGSIQSSWPQTSIMAPRVYPASLASLANSQSHQHPGQYLNSGLGGHLSFQGPLVPLTISRAFGPPPSIRGFGD
ncbi:hypothetical protein O181_075397 [Austropuccinia psidii MF-1]|uniref:Uncharacterized protein n=1 Tax=Austropuccinia psidii MF-1 TaxID=1389203 RepID=A0A9Q3FEX3_9BASI|nr:hypothetical protein [Austropuccinia psidii MF-1]